MADPVTDNQPSPAAIRAAVAISEAASVDWDADELQLVALIIDRHMLPDRYSDRLESR